jgi:hypothetical protein
MYSKPTSYAVIFGYITLSVLVSTCYGANLYAGLQYGYGTSEDRGTYAGEVTTRVYFNDWKHTRDAAWLAYVGVRSVHLGGELGYMKLPTYTSHAEARFPDRAIDQTIEASGHFVRALAFLPGYIEPFVFVGLAQIKGENVEQGVSGGQAVRFESSTKAESLYYGLGVNKHFGSWSVRLEHGLVENAVVSWWTGERWYKITTLGLGYKF